MKILRRKHACIVRTTFAQDERLQVVEAHISAWVLRYSLDSQGRSCYWFADEQQMQAWILSYSQELSEKKQT